MAHAADKVAVRRGDAAFVFGQNAHVATKARPACRRRHDAAGVDERFGVPAPDAFFVNLHRSRNDDDAHAIGDLFPFKIWYAASISSRRPFVQLPMTTWSMAIALPSFAVWVFSGKCG